jgi:Na+/melibiose symporter-like transporter
METDIHSFSATSVALASLVFILVLIPIGKLLSRTGHHSIWCILALFPVLNLFAFWFFAFKPWPTDRKSENTGN